MTAQQWTFIVVTYDGTEAAPVIAMYQNGTADATVATTETGAYVDMEDGATPVLVGAAGTTGAPVSEFNGRITMPFLCGKQLSAAEVGDLYRLTRALVGV